MVSQKTNSDYTAIIQLTPSKPRSLDSVQFLVHVRDSRGRQINSLTQAHILLTMPAMNMGINDVLLVSQGSGNYAGHGQFTMAGDWMMTLHASDHTKEIVHAFPISVK